MAILEEESLKKNKDLGTSIEKLLSFLITTAIHFPDAYFQFLTKEKDIKENKAKEIVFARQITFPDDGNELLAFGGDPLAQLHYWDLDHDMRQRFVPLSGPLGSWFMSVTGKHLATILQGPTRQVVVLNAKTRKAGSSRGVLEVRSHEVPFLLEHEQTVGWLRYERMAASPELLYGEDSNSNYQGQGLKLAKQFVQSALSRY